MNLIRTILSVFMIAIVLLVISGWSWAGGQPSPKAEGARFALALCGVMAVGCLGILWTTKQPQTH